MKHPRRHRRYHSPTTYLLVALASVLFAAAQPSSWLAPESNAVALADLSWASPPSP
ncbi:hypothetical protein [Pelomonas sp. KK5]|uniref:hypothetical protein n=1 Tax=Pelomonas sp. KK5 TaxID=1855730 RepID=UPI0013020254|nr:hypothetical protein [Pelomonas sp. KK5]